MLLIIVIPEGIYWKSKTDLNVIALLWKDFKEEHGRKRITDFLIQQGFTRMPKGKCERIFTKEVGIINGLD